ncbi:unnamed protein product [Alternaria alternata]
MASSSTETTPLVSSMSSSSRAIPPKPQRTVTFNPTVTSTSPKPPSRSISHSASASGHGATTQGGQPMLSTLNSKLRRRNSSGAPARIPPASVPKIGPQRTTRTAQKLKLLPDPAADEAEDEESGRDVYVQYTRIKDPTARRDAARLGKADRERLPRVTAYCTAASYKLDEMMRFLKGKQKIRGAAPKRFDECIYSPYNYGSTKGPEDVSSTAVLDGFTEERPRRFSDSAIEVEHENERRRQDLIDLHEDGDAPEIVNEQAIGPRRPSITHADSDPQMDAPDFDTRVHTPEVFLFEYGTVVIWGMTLQEEKKFLKEIAKFEVDKLGKDEIETEEFNFYYTREYQARIYNDFISLRDKKNYMIKLAISHGLSQSVKTSLFEDLVDNTIDETKDIPAEIASSGKINLNKKQINMQIGELFILRISIHLQGSVLDAPELMWAEPQLDPVYQAVRSYLEMDQRVSLLTERLNVIGDLLAVLKDQLTVTHTFWLFQTYLHDLASAPNSIAFKTCRRIYNRVQRIVFGSAEPQRREKIKENVLPVTVLSSLVLASIAAPFLPAHAGPLAIAQARKPRPVEDIISDNVQTAKVGRSKTVTGGSSRSKEKRVAAQHSDPEDGRSIKASSSRPRDPKELRKAAARPPAAQRAPSMQHRPSLLSIASEARLSSSSLPDFRDGKSSPLPTPPATAGLGPGPLQHGLRKSGLPPRPLTPTALTRTQKIRLLRSNYFRNETQFLSALEDISNRLVVVPKPARLSALRAELALIDQDLPAEVDIPLLSPPTLKDGIPSQSQHHRIVRINPAESTSLNSAERVPYLLMVEVLEEDFDFDPDTEQNQQLLEKLMLEKGTSRRRLFDITNAEYLAFDRTPPNGSDSVFEPATGDLGSTSLIKDMDENDIASGMARVTLPGATANGKATAPRSSSGANTLSSVATLSTPRTSDSQISRSNSPGPIRRMTIPANLNSRNQAVDQPDFSALATHMRTAAQMLAQLEASGAKRPKGEVAAIKAKIIASMQTLEEQNFLNEDQGPTFDTIMAESDPTAITGEPEELEDGLPVATNSGAGAARMENDLKTGGMRRKGDRDDPSAATFGEEWSAKRERIRRSSPYGHMKNWDLISVIVKTGADLRQEAFACQLIDVCTKIWEEANVPVWTKRMRILVTGESCGLIETITNGVSLHSLKRSLTLASIAAGTNPRKRIATLKDHWLKTFGEPDSEAYIAGVGCFARSLAAYSMICYVLQLKDRHNGNLLIDNMGHIIHIDFGFMLSNSPGSMGFEAAPFKLTQDYVDVLGGVTGSAFEEFKTLCKKAFQALRKDAERLIMLVDLMSKNSSMDCFKAGAQTVTNSLRARLMLHLSREEAEGFVEELVAKSVGSYYTRLYDTFQYRTQGIY